MSVFLTTLGRMQSYERSACHVDDDECDGLTEVTLGPTCLLIDDVHITPLPTPYITSDVGSPLERRHFDVVEFKPSVVQEAQPRCTV